MTRKCLVCGKRLEITIKKDRSYTGGHYFGVLEIPVGKGQTIISGKGKIGDKEFQTYKWTGKEKKVEYWECDRCYHE